MERCRDQEIAPTGRETLGRKIVSGRLRLPEKKEEIGNKEQDVYDNQTPSRKPSLQSRKQINGSSKHNQSLYRCNDAAIVIPVPIRNRAFKNKIGDRKEVMMSIVVMRQQIEAAMEEHARRKNDGFLGVQ